MISSAYSAVKKETIKATTQNSNSITQWLLYKKAMKNSTLMSSIAGGEFQLIR